MAQAAVKLLRGYISSLFSADEDAAGCSQFAPGEKNSLGFCWKETAIMA